MKISDDVGLLEEYIEEIVKLGDANSKTLGFLPKVVFGEHASKGQILIAIEDGKLLGYLLYRVSRRGLAYPKAVIMQLCVNQNYRGRGISRILIDALIELTKETFSRIELSCRKDYSSNDIWPKLGFTFSRERPGRAEKGSTLVVWVLVLRELPLLKAIEEGDSKIPVVADASVLFRLMSETPAGEQDMLKAEVLAMQEILEQDIELIKTQETFIEIERNQDQEQKQQTLDLIGDFPTVSIFGEIDEIVNELGSGIFKSQSGNTLSDIKQIADAIAGKVPFFVTQDEGIKNKRVAIEELYDIQILTPGELIAKVDEIKKRVGVFSCTPEWFRIRYC